MTDQENKILLGKLKEISELLDSRIVVRSTVSGGFTFIPSRVGVPEAFCKLYNSGLAYHDMKLCRAKSGEYWIEITFSEVPYRNTSYWNGKKYVKYEG